ncbi:unnamed protein product, partial [Durusdinium trenchii]
LEYQEQLVEDARFVRLPGPGESTVSLRDGELGAVREMPAEMIEPVAVEAGH